MTVRYNTTKTHDMTLSDFTTSISALEISYFVTKKKKLSARDGKSQMHDPMRQDLYATPLISRCEIQLIIIRC